MKCLQKLVEEESRKTLSLKEIYYKNCPCWDFLLIADMVELVDTLVLGTSEAVIKVANKIKTLEQ